MDDAVIFIGTFRIPSAQAGLPAIAAMRDFVVKHHLMGFTR